jgi:hypothetical protein
MVKTVSKSFLKNYGFKNLNDLEDYLNKHGKHLNDFKSYDKLLIFILNQQLLEEREKNNEKKQKKIQKEQVQKNENFEKKFNIENFKNIKKIFESVSKQNQQAKKNIAKINEKIPYVKNKTNIITKNMVKDQGFFKKFKSIAITYRVEAEHGEKSLDIFRTYNTNHIENILHDNLNQKKAFKYNLIFCGEFAQGTSKKIVFIHSSKIQNSTTVLNTSQISKTLKTNFESLQTAIDDFINNGSNWVLKRVLHVDVNILKFNPLNGKSYMELPEWILNKQACINIKNDDDKCFLWSVLAYIHPVNSKKHPNRVSNYKDKESSFNMGDLKYPIKYTDIDKVEKLNPRYGINIFLHEMSKKGNYNIHPLRICKEKKEHEINLLLITYGDLSHYVLIKDTSRLFSRNFNHNRKTYICFNCMNHFYSQEALNNHRENGCLDNEEAKITLPKTENAFIEFKNYKKQLKVPFIIYADFESILIPLKDKNKYQQHQGCSYGYKIVSAYPEYSKPFKMFRGENAVLKFLNALKDEEKWILEIMSKNEDMIITKQQEK